MSRQAKEVVTAAFERAHAVDRVGLGLSENDHGYVAVPRATLLERRTVTEENEVGTRLAVHDLKTVAGQVTLEKAARVRLGLGEEECGRHANETSAALRAGLDVLSRKSVTNDLQATASDDSPEQPHSQQA